MPPQFETVNLTAAGVARWDGAASVVDIVNTAPTYTSAGTAAAWAALFARPTAGSNALSYITNLDIYIEGADAFVTRHAGGVPSAVNGYKWPIGREEAIRNCAQMIRDMRVYLPAGASMWVQAYWGSL